MKKEDPLRKNELEVIAFLSGMIREYKETRTLHDVTNLICETADKILDLTNRSETPDDSKTKK